ncbi:hypothetical protein COCON_G00037860 [Conger conger]|uniref:Uncharacterized protein n=1 Tax=Conger conger TaxID=82655 RepID=A0A9Q1DZZ5_CONCO|nr:hypothetical protein COCON_G00037860 [Conger conger]
MTQKHQYQNGKRQEELGAERDTEEGRPQQLRNISETRSRSPEWHCAEPAGFCAFHGRRRRRIPEETQPGDPESGLAAFGRGRPTGTARDPALTAGPLASAP